MLGDRIKDARERRGLTQEELAEKVHVVRQTVSKWEKGQSVPDADTLMALAEALNVTTSDLIGEDSIQSKNLEELTVQTALLNEKITMQDRRYAKAMGLVKRIAIACAFVAAIAVGASVSHTLYTPSTYSQLSIWYEIDGESEVDGHPREANININSKDDSYTMGYSCPEADHAVFDNLIDGAYFTLIEPKTDRIQLLLHMMEVAIENANGKVLSITYEDESGDRMNNPSSIE